MTHEEIVKGALQDLIFIFFQKAIDLLFQLIL